MAHFTEYQSRRFRFIFNQYSEDAISEAEIETDQLNAGDSKDFDDPPMSWKLKLNYRLTAHELHTLIPRLGPPVSLEQVKLFLYQYESSCTGAMDFEDFLEFLADYQATLAQKRDKALMQYNEQLDVGVLCQISLVLITSYAQYSVTKDIPDEEEWHPGLPIANSNAKVVVARHFICSYPDPNSYLESLQLDDPEFFFTNQETLTSEIIKNGYIDDMNALRRKIVVRVCAARNLRGYSRLKKRFKKEIDYQSMDPLVRVECAGVVHETTAVIGSTKPEWDQDLTFNITIPPGEIQDVQQWVERQTIQVSLLDYNETGVVAHTELVATAFFPLTRVFLSAKKPIWQVLKLNSPDSVTNESDQACIEVSIMDLTQERWAWAKIVDAYTYPEELWLKRHPAKFINDLRGVAQNRKSAVSLLKGMKF
ncbi:hypothetical protein HK101_009344 [Irineochytrium annulatum]|nr:hypothetical protein HK101_009344 [Irineochytrium annulatum]